MSEAAWLQRWVDGRIGFHESSVNSHLVAQWSALAATADMNVFVPLCGKSVDMHWLAERHARVIGVELSEVAAREFFSEADKTPQREKVGAFEQWSAGNVTILVGDFFDLTTADLDGAKAFYDRASLIALPREERQRYAQHLAAVMPADAVGLTIIVDYASGEMKGPPFAVSSEELQALAATIGFNAEPLHVHDVLATEPRFRERGVTQMHEHVYLLRASSKKPR